MDFTDTSIHVRGAAQGDDRSLAWLIERFTPLLVESARYRLGPTLRRHCDPEDVVNELWITVIPRLGSLVPRDGRMAPVLLKFLSTALIRRTNNLARKFALRQDRAAEPDGPSGEGPADRLMDQVTGIVTRLQRQEGSSRVHDLLERLPDRDREIVILRGIEQAPNQEVASALGLDASTVALRYHRALKRLRTMLPDSVFAELVED
ncbi:MAG: sigma-70 family RNA polymerase sigma factor [Planctomycetota bacterium]